MSDTAYAGRTAWARSLRTPLREFLRTETGSACVLLAATVAALAWANVDAGSYERRLGDAARAPARRARARARPAPLGEQRPDGAFLPRRRARGAARVRPRRAARSRAASRCRCWPGSAGWCCRSRSSSPSTPASRRRTAGAPRCRPTPRSRSGCSRCSGGGLPDRLRAFLLTVAVVDDLVALAVIAFAYSGHARGPAAARDRRDLRCHPRRPRRRHPQRARLRGSRRGGLGRARALGRRPGRRRPRARAPDLRLRGAARRPRARNRPLPALPRAADAGARPLGADRRRLGDLAERAAARALAPVDELRDRAALRARERRASRSPAASSPTRTRRR